MTGRVLVLGAAGRFGLCGCRSVPHGRLGGGEPGAAGRRSVACRVAPGRSKRSTVQSSSRPRAGPTWSCTRSIRSYTNWPRLALPLAYSAIDIAEVAGATLMFPGNIYNYGAAMPDVLDETTPMAAEHAQGQVARRDRAAHAGSIRARGPYHHPARGDFFGAGAAPGSISCSRRTSARHRHVSGADRCGARMGLSAGSGRGIRAARHLRERFGAFETFGFPGHAVTGREFVAALTKAAQRGLQIRRMPWWLIHLLRALIPVCRELSEMAYSGNSRIAFRATS